MPFGLGALGALGWIIAILLLVILVAIESAVCIGFGQLCAKVQGPARLALWPVALVLGIALFPGLGVALLAYGFMSPDFGGHIKPREEQSTGQRSLNGMLEVIANPVRA